MNLEQIQEKIFEIHTEWDRLNNILADLERIGDGRTLEFNITKKIAEGMGKLHEAQMALDAYGVALKRSGSEEARDYLKQEDFWIG